jgi:hypothetical protein
MVVPSTTGDVASMIMNALFMTLSAASGNQDRPSAGKNALSMDKIAASMTMNTLLWNGDVAFLDVIASLWGMSAPSTAGDIASMIMNALSMTKDALLMAMKSASWSVGDVNWSVDNVNWSVGNAKRYGKMVVSEQKRALQVQHSFRK